MAENPQTPPPEPKPLQPSTRARRGTRAFLILGVVAALAVGGYLLHAYLTAGRVETDNAQVESDVVAVSARVGGAVKEVKVGDNEPVTAGQVLVELDATELEVRVRQAEAELESAVAQADAADAQVEVVRASSAGSKSSADAQLAGSGAGVRTATAMIDAAKAALTRAESDRDKTATDLARAEQLAQSGAISQAQLDAARSAHDVAVAAAAQADAQVTSAREQAKSAQSKVAEAKARVTQSSPVDAQIRAATAASTLAHARVKVADAALAQARLSLSYTTIVAPADGTLSRFAIHAGQTVQAGQPLVQLVPTKTYVVANFKETEVGRLRRGQHVTIDVDAFPSRHFHGVVASLSPATGARFSLLPPDNATGNFVKVVQRVPVRIEWDAPPDVPMRAGLSADVVVQLSDP